MEPQPTPIPATPIKKKPLKAVFMVLLAIAIILIALFFKPLSELLSLFGSKAELISDSVELNDTSFFDGHTSTPQDGFKMEDGKLKLNPITPN